jgi:hypothetical protein
VQISFDLPSLDAISAFLMAIIAIQRHTLVFHERILNTRIKRFTLYYVPLLFCVFYTIIIYLILIVFYPCDGTQWTYTANVCSFANCHLLYIKTLATFDWIAHNCISTLFIILANIFIMLRVVNQKCRHYQRITWRKQRCITLQLLSISILFLIAWLPSLIIAFV